MPPRLIACVLGVLGGTLWVLRWLLTSPGTVPAQALHWAGSVSLLAALAFVGAGLVTGSARALRLVVAVALPLLVWSVAELVRPAGAVWFDGVLGAVALAWAMVPLLLTQARSSDQAPQVPAPRRGGSRVATKEQTRHRGSHSR